MDTKQISNIYNPSEYLKEMADEETGRDEREPYQLELPFDSPIEVREMTDDEIVALLTLHQHMIVGLQKQVEELNALVHRVWGAR